MSIRKALLRSSMLLAILLTTLVTLGFWYTLGAIVELDRLVGLVGDAGRLALMVTRAPPGSDPAFEVDLRPELFGGRFQGDSADSYYQVWSARGDTIVRSPSLGSADLPKPGLVDHSSGPWAPTQPPATRGETFRAENQDLEVSPIQIPGLGEATMCWIRYSPMRGPLALRPGEADEFVVVAVARSAQADAAQTRLQNTIVISFGLLAVLLFRLGIGLLISRGLRPLTTLRDRVRTIDPADRRSASEQRVSEEGLSEESQPIARAINALLDRTARVLERERQFSRSAAHELRTPLAEIRATAEVAIRGDVAHKDAALRTIALTAAQMDGVLSTLLALARKQMAGDQISRVHVDLAATLHDSITPHVPALSARGITAHVLASPGLVAHTDETALRTAIRNLIDNAAEYTHPGGSITLRAQAVPGRICCTFSNGPTSLTPSDLPNLFQPFWRQSPARGEGEHAGLGLTIVQAVCESLGATIETSLDGHTFTITLELPAGDHAMDA